MNPPRRAFTIVELLVVIAIIAALMGLLLPALSGAQRRSRKSEEVNRLRQVGVAWNLYANGNRDAALPGFLDATLGAAGQTVQEAWRVKYELPNGDPVPPADAEEWPWRLAPYLSYDQDTLMGHLGLDQKGPLPMSDYSLLDEEFVFPGGQVRPQIPRPVHVAQEPGFAYNGYYVGGWWEMSEIEDGWRKARYGNVFPVDADGKPLTDTRLNMVARSPASIRNTSNMLIFCSAGLRQPGERSGSVDGAWPGSHVVTPPYLADQEIWNASSINPADTQIRVSTALDTALNASPAPCARYTDQVAVLYGDLHSEPEAPGDLADQRIWINAADNRWFRHSQN